ncbi:aminotransferase class V-fold PLP-dependent enzyme, partial [Candidatus Saccharibacteria bacterium]|nr:aminotransferase class V-fold PLP-dependent enzyme [Candidatus Saccharibacteria bacterium]
PVSFPGVDAERIMYKLEEKQVYLSTGAACAANKGAKSHVLTAIGLSDEEIAGSLRISLGVLNTEENAKEAGKLIVQAVSEETQRVSGGKQAQQIKSDGCGVQNA